MQIIFGSKKVLFTTIFTTLINAATAYNFGDVLFVMSNFEMITPALHQSYLSNFQTCETGLYVCMQSFLGFGRKYVEKYSNKTGTCHLMRQIVTNFTSRGLLR